MIYTSIVVLVVLVLLVVFLYNRLITLRNRAKEALSDIDVQSKRRYDLIPNLVETVKGYAAHEKGLLENVTAARTAAMSGGSAFDRAKSEDTLSGTLKSLFAVAENYPDLKANVNFLELQRELSDTENKMMASRRFYNSTVNDLNTAITKFPNNLLAGMFGFEEQKFFEVSSQAEKEPVKVSF
ncbi:MAG TPA: LemA family protein [Candidatus Paceibacterota bacterium]